MPHVSCSCSRCVILFARLSSHLHHVDKPKDGITDGVKQAYLADHSGGANTMSGKKGCQKCGDNCRC